jgi:LPXTG-motif cell wall-anchored protein
MANGTWVVFTAPRTSQTDFAGVAPGGAQTHENRGRAEVQLAAEEPPPTAITLNDVGLNTGDSIFVLIWIALLIVSGATWVIFKRFLRAN